MWQFPGSVFTANTEQQHHHMYPGITPSGWGNVVDPKFLRHQGRCPGTGWPSVPSVAWGSEGDDFSVGLATGLMVDTTAPVTLSPGLNGSIDASVIFSGSHVVNINEHAIAHEQQEQYSEGGTDKEEVIDATLGELGRSQASSANIGGPVERADPCLQGQASTVIGGRRVSESTEDCARTLVSRLHASGTTSGNAESPYNTRQGDSALIAESGNLATSPPGETTIIYPAELQHDMTSLDGPPLRKGGAASRSKQDKNTGSLSAVPKYTAKYRCGTCGKVFNQSGNLNRHRVVHTRERPFKCTICGKGFSQKSHVRTHQTVHTGVKAFQCNYCPKRFSQLGHLNGHIERHRRVGEIAPFDNDIYGASSKNMPYSDPTTPLVQNSSQLTTPPACNALVVVHAIAPLPTADLQAPGLDRINDLELQSNDLVPGTGPRGAASTAPKLALATLNHAPPGTDARSVAADEGIATDHTSSPFKISSSPSTSDSDSGRDSNGS